MTTETQETPGNRVRLARQRLGWSQGELSRRTGLRTETISRGETGEVRMSRKTIEAVAEALGVSIDWILQGRTMGPPVGNPALAAFLAEAPGVTDDERRTLESVEFFGVRPTKLTYSMIWGALRTTEKL